MATLNLLYRHSYQINDYIQIRIPTVWEVLENEEHYYNAVALLTATPIDMMLQLDEMGIDFEAINDFDLFMIVFRSLKDTDLSLIFGDLDCSGFETVVNLQNNQLMFADRKTGARIDRAIQGQIAAALRKIHGLERNNRRPANKAARDFIMERAKVKASRRKRLEESTLERDIIALVNTSEFSYDYESVRNMTIYQFNESLKQIIKKINYDNRMHGIYAGTVDAKELSQADLTWLTRTSL